MFVNNYYCLVNNFRIKQDESEPESQKFSLLKVKSVMVL